uniref:ubiquinone biosynthesis O-methyltransferase, mitochondrial isoform X2 n=1 Tax=Myxine glutinosa TaxID=7769 RepID=UPI00358EDD0D
MWRLQFTTLVTFKMVNHRSGCRFRCLSGIGTLDIEGSAGSAYAAGHTLDPTEVAKFRVLSRQWWNERGKFAALHRLNDLRVPFVRDGLLLGKPAPHSAFPLQCQKILDVGCGGGLLSEALARLGASVTGVDPVRESIGVAKTHAAQDPALKDKLKYLCGAVEDLLPEQSETFDGVVASEVLEHVVQKQAFLDCCGSLVKPGGSIFVTTLNRSSAAFTLAIVAAERLLRIVPTGTHDWNLFITPKELCDFLEKGGLEVQELRGMLYNPASCIWSWIASTDVNYALQAIKHNLKSTGV